MNVRAKRCPYGAAARPAAPAPPTAWPNQHGGQAKNSQARLDTANPCFLPLKWNFVASQLVPVEQTRLVAGHDRAEPASASCTPPDTYLCALVGSPSAFSTLNKPGSLSLSSYEKMLKGANGHHGPLLDSPGMSVPLSYWGAQNRAQYCRCDLTGLHRTHQTCSAHCPDSVQHEFLLRQPP